MATLRGERFHLDLEGNDESDSMQAETPSLPPPPVTNFVGDIQERPTAAAIAPRAPSLKNTTTGFPAHRKRSARFKQQSGLALGDLSNTQHTDSSTSDVLMPSPGISPSSTRREFIHPEDLERHQIDQENRQRLATMSDAEIESERQELLAGMNPALIQRLLQRSTIEDKPASGWNPAYSQVEGGKKEDKEDMKSGKRPSFHQRKVSFAVPDEPESVQEQRRSTAGRHSIPMSTSPSTSPSIFQDPPRSPSKKKRPSVEGRKVSFATEVDTSHDAENKVTAKKHSVPGESSQSPGLEPSASSQPALRRISINPLSDNSPYIQPLNPIDHNNQSPYLGALRLDEPVNSIPGLASGQSSHTSVNPLSSTAPSSDEISVHFPKPAQPDLDPASSNFLDDLHKKYFPSLSHDPTKLAWLTSTTSTSPENAAYNPASVTSIAPADVRFDFSGALLPPSISEKLPTNLGLHNHGDQPGSAGYTIAELARLARSSFPGQRCMAMQTLGRILYRLGNGEFGDENNLVEIPVPGMDVIVDPSTGQPPEVETSVRAEKAKLAKGLWDAVEMGRVTDTLVAEAGKERGHATSIAIAQEAVWLWQRGGGRKRKAI